MTRLENKHIHMHPSTSTVSNCGSERKCHKNRCRPLGLAMLDVQHACRAGLCSMEYLVVLLKAKRMLHNYLVFYGVIMIQEKGTYKRYNSLAQLHYYYYLYLRLCTCIYLPLRVCIFFIELHTRAQLFLIYYYRYFNIFVFSLLYLGFWFVIIIFLDLETYLH